MLFSILSRPELGLVDNAGSEGWSDRAAFAALSTLVYSAVLIAGIAAYALMEWLGACKQYRIQGDKRAPAKLRKEALVDALLGCAVLIPASFALFPVFKVKQRIKPRQL